MYTFLSLTYLSTLIFIKQSIETYSALCVALGRPLVIVDESLVSWVITVMATLFLRVSQVISVFGPIVLLRRI